MLVTFSKSFPLDFEDFQRFFPYSANFARSDDYSFFVHPKVDLSLMDFITWFLDDFCEFYPQRIDFDYADIFESATVVFPNGCVIFTFFRHE